MITLESLLGAYVSDLIKFLKIILHTARIDHIENYIEQMKSEAFEIVPPEAPRRAALLLHAHSIVRRRQQSREIEHPRRSSAMTTIDFNPEDLAEGNVILARNHALLQLEINERCAVALYVVGVTPEERDYVLGREFELPSSECDALTQGAITQFNHHFWVAEHRPIFVFHVEKMATSNLLDGNTDGPSIGRLLRATELDLESLAEDVTGIVRLLDEASIPAGERLLAIKTKRASALLVSLLDVLDPGDARSPAPEHVIMLTYNSKDTSEVRGLYDRMSAQCDPDRHHIWVDWLGIDKDKDPFLLTASVILALSRAYVISLGRGLLGDMQRWEKQSAEYLCRSEPKRRRLAVAKLATLPEDAEIEVDPAVPHRHVDLRQDPERAVRELVDYLTA